jgi:hypothetical protein
VDLVAAVLASNYEFAANTKTKPQWSGLLLLLYSISIETSKAEA